MKTLSTRAKEAAHLDGITKKIFVHKTGFSEHQWYSWFGNGKEQHSPSAEQYRKILDSLDWSALFIFQGIGPHKMAELIDILGVEDQTHKHRAGANEHREVSQKNSETLARLEKLMENSEFNHRMVKIDRKLDRILEALRSDLNNVTFLESKTKSHIR